MSSYKKYRWEKNLEVKTIPTNANSTKIALIGTTASNKAVLKRAQRIYLDGMSGADVVWVDNASDNEIHGGTGSDTVYLSGTAKYNYVDGGNGNDHIVIQAPDGRSNRNMILGGGNKDTFILRMTLERAADGSVTVVEREHIPCAGSGETNRNNYQPTPYEPDSDGWKRVMSKLDGSWTGSNLSIGYGYTANE